MVGRFEHMKQGDLPGPETVFMCHDRAPKSRPIRSQSVHSSDEAG